MNILYFSLAVFLSLTPSTHAATADDEPPQPQPCTIRSPHSGAFFDLNILHIPPPALSKAKNPRANSWNATGFDLGYNFTLNFCGGVIEDLAGMGGVEGVPEELWRNVSAYYKQDGKIYSIGRQSHNPVIRGRKLVLNYTDGSPCPAHYSLATGSAPAAPLHAPRDIIPDPLPDSSPPAPVRRKSTIISMLCERDALMPLLTLSFIATPDECTYIFEARTSAACAGIEVAKQTLSPAGVFGMIALIAFIVYIVGGCVYSRTVLQQRGWKQLPNYHLWAGMAGFFAVRGLPSSSSSRAGKKSY